MNIPVITVSEINRYVKKMFDSEIMMQSMLISGEISNLSPHYRSGHLYFSLKDENASLKAVMFSSNAKRLSFMPENGMKVLAIGRVSVYERDGVYQLYVDRMQPDGEGALSAAFDRLKKKLEKEGLFDSSHKKKLPSFPSRIGVITSPAGAAVQDIFNITARRFPLCDIVFSGVSVQGANAAPEMIAALNELNEKECCDVIIIGRGGGSAEDLWCFNDEMLARAVYASKIPVISAVGHETDFTICDFVADMRAPTPSAAAELATPDLADLTLNTEALCDRLYSAFGSHILHEKQKLKLLLAKRSFTDPGKFFDSEKNRLSTAMLKLNTGMEKLLSMKKTELQKNISALSSLNPLSVLTRGYAAVSAGGVILDSTKNINKGDNLTVQMADGDVKCEVLEVIRRNTDGTA